MRKAQKAGAHVYVLQGVRIAPIRWVIFINTMFQRLEPELNQLTPGVVVALEFFFLLVL